MPIKNDHGLYATIMSAMPDIVRCEVDSYCAKNGLLKSVFVISHFGSYESKRLIAQWFQAIWNKYQASDSTKSDVDLKKIDRMHYDKVIKIMPPHVKRDAFICAATKGLKKMVLIESVFGAYDFRKIIEAWFYAVWRHVKTGAMSSH